MSYSSKTDYRFETTTTTVTKYTPPPPPPPKPLVLREVCLFLFGIILVSYINRNID
jgi:hypothetical protein